MTTPFPTEPLRDATVDGLGWLAGRWLGTRGTERVEEVWSPPANGSMIGTFRWDRGGTAWFYELLTIEPDGDTLLMRIKHFHPGLVGWEERDVCVTFAVVALGPDEAVLMQRDTADAPWLVYRLVAGALETYFQRGDTVVSDAEVFRYART